MSIGQIECRILELLRARGCPVSGQRICSEFGLTRAAIWKHVEALRNADYQIEAAPGRGYRLVSAPDRPYPWEVTPLLETVRLGRSFHYLDETDSTNREAGDMAAAGAPEGAVVVAETQTGGRGRMNRTWFSPPGASLYFSVVLRPPIVPHRAPQISLVAALALARALELGDTELTVGFKWPNDLLIGDRKISGILCDMRAETDRVHWLVLGIGLNVNVRLEEFPEELRETATSLRRETGRVQPRVHVLARVLGCLERVYGQWLDDGLSSLLPELEQRSVLNGSTIAVDSGREVIRGTVRGLSERGGIVLEPGEKGAGLREIVCGDIHILRMSDARGGAVDQRH